MTRIPLAALAIAFAAAAAPASAATPDCYGGYKTFMGKIAPLIGKVEDVDLATLMRRGLSVYDACQAGDNFSPYGVWDQIFNEMTRKATK